MATLRPDGGQQHPGAVTSSSTPPKPGNTAAQGYSSQSGGFTLGSTHFAGTGNPQLDLFLEAINSVEDASGNPAARNPSGAYGFWQMMPSTFASWAKGAGLSHPDIRDPQQQFKAAAYGASQYYNQYHDWGKAALAWLAGPGAVASGNYNASDGNITGNQYVDRVLSYMAQHGTNPSQNPNAPGADVIFGFNQGQLALNQEAQSNLQTELDALLQGESAQRGNLLESQKLQLGQLGLDEDRLKIQREGLKDQLEQLNLSTAQQKRQLKSSATASGALGSMGYSQGQKDIAEEFHLGQRGLYEQSLNLNIMEKQLGISRQQIENSTKQALQKLGLDTLVSSADIFQALIDAQSGQFNILSDIAREVAQTAGLVPGAPLPDTTGRRSGGNPSGRT